MADTTTVKVHTSTRDLCSSSGRLGARALTCDLDVGPESGLSGAGAGAGNDPLVMCDHIATVDLNRLAELTGVRTLEEMQRVDQALSLVLDL